MKTLIKILCLSSFLIAEDVYPYFSEPAKQLEFEERKINIIEIEEKEMVISGGSKFNFWYLIDNNQPAIVPGDIKTDYVYKYKFEIIHNNKLLSEIQLLELIGLDDRANEIRDDYKSKIDNYNSLIKNNVSYDIKFKNFDRSKHLMLKGDLNYILQVSNITLLCFLAQANFTNLDKYLNAERGTKAKKHYQNNLLKSLLLTASSIYINKSMNNNIVTVKDILNIEKPILKQTLTDQQLKSISESYNRKIYNEILEK